MLSLGSLLILAVYVLIKEMRRNMNVPQKSPSTTTMVFRAGSATMCFHSPRGGSSACGVVVVRLFMMVDEQY